VCASGAKRTVAAPIHPNPPQGNMYRRPAPVCVCLACIGGASANWGGARGEEIGGSRLRAGPGEGTAHAPVN
jgi:hypothetical protein